MKIQFEADFISRYVFQPIYSMDGRLLALEILSRFNSLDGDLVMPIEIGIHLLDPLQKIELFNEQLLLVEQYALWFVEHQVLLSIPIEEDVVDGILSDAVLRQRLRQLPFIVLGISEAFTQLSAGKNNKKISRLSEVFTLWLNNFGSGKATLNGLYDGLFDYVKIDKHFYWRLFAQQGHDVMFDSLLKNINLLCRGVIVTGIENRLYLNKLRYAGIYGLQGGIWPSINVDNLDVLCAVPDEFKKY
ncbi:EAL domain-containing protein [Serratia sp. NPDC078593]|uniref:EAL domain-containing protein n=1 Tax=unclassified Serratia (in: enterobacteria) TaxID=2647522 RepID=UPI0037CCC7FE